MFFLFFQSLGQQRLNWEEILQDIMRKAIFLQFLLGTLACFSIFCANAEDPYRYYTWVVKYGQRAPLGVSQRVCFYLQAVISLFVKNNVQTHFCFYRNSKQKSVSFTIFRSFLLIINFLDLQLKL